MLRRLYILLLRLHPAAFRQRFGHEMLEIFENAHGWCAPLLLIADALASVIRQWTFRSEFRRPLMAATISDVYSNVPEFRTIDPYRPRSTALIHGGFLAVALFCGFVMAVHHGVQPRRFLIGSHHPRPHLFPVAGASVAATELNTVVTLGSVPDDPWLRPIASVYFQQVRVLAALDADKNLIISAWEIVAAPEALRRVDTDDDGKLAAEECGFFVNANLRMPPKAVQRGRRDFMRRNPVLDALDRDHDGEISATEIAKSSSALKSLDRNHDRSLTPAELIPDQIAIQAAIIMVRFDRNEDGSMSAAEWTTKDAESLRDIFESADWNRDGAITQQELKNRLRFRDERKRILDAVRRAVGFR